MSNGFLVGHIIESRRVVKNVLKQNNDRCVMIIARFLRKIFRREALMPDKLLETQDVASLLGVDKRTIQRYLHDGKIKGGVKVGRAWRIPEESVLEFIRNQGTLFFNGNTEK